MKKIERYFEKNNAKSYFLKNRCINIVRGVKFAPKTRNFAKKLKKIVQKIFFFKNRCINIARGVKIAPKTAKE